MRYHAGSSLLAVAICNIAVPAGAQTTTLQPAKQDAGPASSASLGGNQQAEPSEVDDIVVTGSRLPASGFNQPTPVTVIGAELVQQRASPNLAQTLSELPAFRNSNGSNQSQRTSTAPISRAHKMYWIFAGSVQHGPWCC